MAPTDLARHLEAASWKLFKPRFHQNRQDRADNQAAVLQTGRVRHLHFFKTVRKFSKLNGEQKILVLADLARHQEAAFWVHSEP